MLQPDRGARRARRRSRCARCGRTLVTSSLTLLGLFSVGGILQTDTPSSTSETG
jgi:hypothetical protein